MREELVKKYNVRNNEVDILSPLTVGNGSLCMTCDVTGLQTLINDYNVIPLMTMLEKFAHKKDLGNIKLEEYEAHNRKVYYMTNNKEEAKYDALRTNYFKYNMFNLAFYYNDKRLNKNDIKDINQELDLYTSTLYSNFKINDELVEVKTYVSQDSDKINVEIKSNLLNKDLSVRLSFKDSSYNKLGEEDIFTGKLSLTNNLIKIEDKYREDKILVKTNGEIKLVDNYLEFKGNNNLNISLNIESKKKEYYSVSDFFNRAKPYLSKDEEINRRIVLSLYLIKINSCATLPPSETGLTLNSWYGKFHLEMHLWHHLGLIYYGCYKEVIPSLDYYFTIYEEAKKRAELNGFKGCRWPKMTDETGLDSPSNIGPLLMWQQPHLLFMLFTIKELNKDFDLTKYNILIRDTLACLVSFFYKENDTYYLDYPLLAAQEFYDIKTLRSPIFEVEYFRYIFNWAIKLNYGNKEMEEIVLKAVRPNIYDNAYEGHINTIETYTKFNFDHPLPIMPYSFFAGDRIDKNIMLNTINKVLKTWQVNTMWGWDFPSLAMVYNNLGLKEEAIKMLKANYPKNLYLKNGHNIQYPDEMTLPIYLPGNGAFLIASYNMFKENIDE